MIKFDKNEKVCYNIRQDEMQYIICPCCKKQKLFRINENSKFNEIYVWCKFCKKEICLKSREP